LLALSLRLVGSALLATLYVLVKWAVESGVAFAEALFWRQFLTVPAILAWLAWQGQVSRLGTRRLGTHARRAVVGTTGMLFTFGAPLLLPLAESTALGFTTPLFAVMLAALFLKERVGPVRWLAVALGFAGVLVIAQPGQAHIEPFGAFVGIVAGFLVAVISILVRDLGRTDEPVAVVFWFAALSSPILALFLPFFASAHTPFQWFILGVIGLTGCIAQLFLTASLRLGQVASVTVMDYAMLVWMGLYGWIIWDQQPPAATYFGAPLIIAAGLVIAWREHRLYNRAVPATAA
jgi:drug/metabolite transporter (DMT)-like permease